MIVSPPKTCAVYEVWIFAAPDHREAVSACGIYRAVNTSDYATHLVELEAVRMASRLRDYLHLGVWTDNLGDNTDDMDDIAELRLLPEYLHSRGIDPARVLVAARRIDGTHDNAESDVPRGWSPYRKDAGHAPAGPVVMRSRRW